MSNQRKATVGVECVEQRPSRGLRRYTINMEEWSECLRLGKKDIGYYNSLNKKEGNMSSREAMKRLYNFWLSQEGDAYGGRELLNSCFTQKEQKCMFLSSGVVGLTTYDGNLDMELGQELLEILIQIRDKTTFDYIEDKQNYKRYVICCNFIEDWLEWGTSIRGAWFRIGGKIETHEYLGNIGFDSDSITITSDFMNWFIEWLCKE